MRAWLGADFRKRLETADAAVEEAGRLRVQLAAKLAEARQGQHVVRIHMHTVAFQQRRQLFGARRVETRVDVINAEAQLVSQHARGADVRGNHRLFNDTVSDAARLGHDIQHFAFLAQHKAVIRAIFKHQRVFGTPGAAALANLLQQADLRGNRLAARLPLAFFFQPVGNVVIGQFGFRFDGGGEEVNVVADNIVDVDNHAADQRRALHAFTQRAEIVRQLARQHRDVKARQVVGERAHFRDVIKLAAFGDPRGRVGNRDGQLQAVAIQRFHIQRIVHIFGAGAVDGDEIERG
ncbi:hypothetical protein BN129_1224 [Cronobacter sakazakii 701]|nr:hypothetical protein BN129_1224 [Cronobacter sakazakii 701]